MFKAENYEKQNNSSTHCIKKKSIPGKYYDEIAKVLSEFADTAVYKEYVFLIDTIFSKYLKSNAFDVFELIKPSVLDYVCEKDEFLKRIRDLESLDAVP